MNIADIELVVKIPESIWVAIQNGEYCGILDDRMYNVIKNGTPIPDNATNGDVVKTLFSNTFDNFCERTTWEWNRWWNSPYQKGGKK